MTDRQHPEALVTRVLDAEAVAYPGSIWRHVKTGHVYIVECCALVEADLSVVVVYRRLHELGLNWTRPFDEFTDGRFAPYTD